VKILIAVHHFPPRFTGGAEWRAYRTAAQLQERGHEAEVVAVERIDNGPPGGISWVDEVYDGVHVRRLSFNLALSPDRERWEYDNPWIGDHLAEMFRERRPDIFHLIGGYLISGRALWAAEGAGIPSVVSLTDFWFLCRRISMLRSDGKVSTLPIDPLTCARCLAEEKRRYRLPARFLPGLMDKYWQAQPHRAHPIEARLNFLRDSIHKASAVISPSMFLKSVYTQAGINPDRFIFSRQGRDFPDLTPGLLTKTPSDQIRIGYLGQIAWLKGVHVLFEAAASLTDLPIEVKAFGDKNHFPDYAASLERYSTANSRIRLAGSYKSAELSQILRDLDVLVVSSLWYENSPNVILEAFAHRTPVIASDLGGMAELVTHDRNGLLFTPGDPASLAQQIRRLADEPELLEKLRTGIEPVRPVSDEMDELEELYSEILRQPVEIMGNLR
jgi:glycosyltransferase involved in cell wall biosynthesis